MLLSTLAHASQHDDEAAFQAGVKRSERRAGSASSARAMRRRAIGRCAPRAWHKCAPKLRAKLVDACAACICADMSVSVEEGELLRAICDMLNCPMPPLLPGQEVSPSLFAAPAVGPRLICQPAQTNFGRPLPTRLSPGERSFCVRCGPSSTSRDFIEVETPLVASEIIPELHIDPMQLADGSVSAIVARAAHEAVARRRCRSDLSGDALISQRRTRSIAQPRIHDRRVVSRWRRHDGRNRSARCIDANAARHATGDSHDLRRRRLNERFSFVRIRASIDELVAAAAKGMACRFRKVWTKRIAIAGSIFCWPCGVEPELGRDRPEIIYHYPASQASLAKVVRSPMGTKSLSDLSSTIAASNWPMASTNLVMPPNCEAVSSK